MELARRSFGQKRISTQKDSSMCTVESGIDLLRLFTCGVRIWDRRILVSLFS